VAPSDVEIIPLQRAPSFWGSYRVALFGGRKRPVIGGAVPLLPALGLSLPAQPPEPERLARFRAVCGFADASALPITWPQVVAGALHGALLSDPRVPFPLMGLVHVRNTITQLRPILPHEALGLVAKFGEARAANRGVELTIHTEARVGEELVWRSTLSALVPGTGPHPPRPLKAVEPAPTGDHPGRTRSLVLDVAEDTGRRYAAVAGDYNPIHLWALTAKAFGFPRAIVHGMWSLGRIASALHDETTGRGGPWRLDARFKKPVFLPSKALLSSGPREDGQEFSLCAADRRDLLLVGSLVRVRADDP
jgi:acyl dehydratase